MFQGSFAMEPRALTVAGMSVLPQMSADRSGDLWNVTIVFSRSAGLPAMQGQDVDVQLIDSNGAVMPVVERPSGPLVEFGGSLGNSVNAAFSFRSSHLEPKELVVTYQGEAGRFRVVSSK